jgi:DNA-binding transcriptional MerR regulator
MVYESLGRFTSAKVRKILKCDKNTLIRWEASGKIPKPKRDPMSGYRYWTAEDVKKLKKITGR